jgi:hypothetical protein
VAGSHRKRLAPYPNKSGISENGFAEFGVDPSVELRGLEPLTPSLRTRGKVVAQARLSRDRCARRHLRPLADDGVAVPPCCTSRRCRFGSPTHRFECLLVFISSVTHSLKDERKGLAKILGLVESYEALRFEDFKSQDRSSPEACLAAVFACDVYVLLLGPTYGQRRADSGLSPTEEEFTRARRLGKPILVFTKTTDEADQSEFKARVEHYVNGRFPHVVHRRTDAEHRRP